MSWRFIEFIRYKHKNFNMISNVFLIWLIIIPNHNSQGMFIVINVLIQIFENVDLILL